MPRKTLHETRAVPCERQDASMRPRPDAAENHAAGRRRQARADASMRPRPDAAENVGRDRRGPRPRLRFNEAAARCRGKPRRGSCWICRARCFNEAAARCRGKHGQDAPAGRERDPASMRPRPDAAENRHDLAFRGRRRNASMRPRPDAAENKRRLAGVVGGADARFNEAAARCRGKLRLTDNPSLAKEVIASMRPRPDAAENGDKPINGTRTVHMLQ